MKAAYAAAFGAAFLAGAASRLKLGHAGSGQSVDERAIKSIRRDMRYGSGEAQTFDLYLPAAERDSYGLVVYIHGGGFTGGDKREDAPLPLKAMWPPASTTHCTRPLTPRRA